MKITAIPVGMLETNCYILTDEETGLSAVIDPGFVSPKLEELVSALPAEKVALCLLTHGHFDHIDGAPKIREMTGAPICIPRLDAHYTGKTKLSPMERMYSSPDCAFEADRLLEDGEVVELGSLRIKVMHTPGHTAGSCCFLVNDVMFSGDTLMQGSIGRTDLPTGDMRQMEQSLKKLVELPGDYHVLSGHGPATTLERERKYNPYLNDEGYFG